MAVKMLRDIQEKLEEQLNYLAMHITNDLGSSLDQNVEVIMGDLGSYKHKWTNGIEKSRLIKLLLNEVIELRDTRKDMRFSDVIGSVAKGYHDVPVERVRKVPKPKS